MDSNLSIRADDRVTLVGKTGSGKSYFARYLLYRVKRLIVCDPKGEMDNKEWNLVDETPAGWRALARGKPYRMRIKPPRSVDEWDIYFERILQLRRLTLYVDELYGVGPLSSDGLQGLYTRGRELGLSVWSSTQRPTWIPRFALSEAGWLFVFKLTLEDDRERIADIIGPEGMTELDGHEFLAYNDASGEVMKFHELRVKGLQSGKTAL